MGRIRVRDFGGAPQPRRGLQAYQRRSLRPISRLGDVPKAVQKAIAKNIARLLIFHERVEGLAFVGPLLCTVVTADDRVTIARRIADRGCQRGPIAGARAVASGLATVIPIKSVKRHAFGID